MSIENPFWEYPNIEGVGGIDWDNILNNPQKTGIYYSASGRTLHFEVSDTSILLSDRNMPGIRLLRSDYSPLNNSCKFYLFTQPLQHELKNEERKRHPDLYASAFMHGALEYFRSKGHDVQKICCQWDRFSDNFTSFMSNYNHDRNDRLTAALSTWTAKVCMKEGYSQISSADIEFGYQFLGDYSRENILYVLATFYRADLT